MPDSIRQRPRTGQSNIPRAQTPILWSPKSGTAYSDALDRIIGTASEIKTVKTVVETELKRIIN